MSGRTHLVIPDAHAHPDYHNKRFTWLGKLVADIKPDVVVGIGDWADMPSLCTYDMGKQGYEGKRYLKDITAAVDAQDHFFWEVKKAKKKLPRFVMHEGNHEYRIKKAISADPAHLDGIISPNDLGYRQFGWEYIEYNGSTPGINIIDGVAYAHYFTSGTMGRPISGQHPAYQLLIKQFHSCTQGHTHTLDFCIRTDAGGKYVYGLVCGVYQDFFADFAGEANNLWWPGVVVKRHVENGCYDPEFISLERIRKAYG